METQRPAQLVTRHYIRESRAVPIDRLDRQLDLRVVATSACLQDQYGFGLQINEVIEARRQRNLQSRFTHRRRRPFFPATVLAPPRDQTEPIPRHRTIARIRRCCAQVKSIAQFQLV